jgi:hypothetical protein
MSNFLRILRVLELQDELLVLIPATGPSPMDLLKMRGRERKRASPRRAEKGAATWAWDDES